MNTKSSLAIFDFNESPVRVSIDKDGAPWFVAADVCRVLDLDNNRQAVAALDEDEKITVSNPDGNPRAGIPHTQSFVSESGLYALIFKSRKQEARAFRKWVTKEVLPEIRKTGSYSSNRELLEREERQINSMIDLIGSVIDQRARGKIDNGTVAVMGTMAAQFLRAWDIKLRIRSDSVFRLNGMELR